MEGWSVLLKSGVHGVGGFRNPANWAWGSPGGEIAGEDLAEDFWDSLDTMPVGVAWIDTMYWDNGDLQRDPYYITQEDCNCEESLTCDSRFPGDFYWGRESGPMDDLHDAEVTHMCVVRYDY